MPTTEGILVEHSTWQSSDIGPAPFVLVDIAMLKIVLLIGSILNQNQELQVNHKKATISSKSAVNTYNQQ